MIPFAAVLAALPRSRRTKPVPQRSLTGIPASPLATAHQVLICLCLAAFALSSRAAETVAQVVTLRGVASVRAPGAPDRALQVGAPLHVGEQLITGPGAAIRLAFSDGTDVYLGAETELTIQVYGAQPDSLGFVANLAKGVFRVVTGLIARMQPQSVTVVMPVAVIGLRGTHFGGETDGSSAVVVLLEPAETGSGAAIDVSNPFGSVTIDEPGYGTEIPDASSPPSPPRRMRLRAVENLIRSLSGIPRLPPRR